MTDAAPPPRQHVVFSPEFIEIVRDRAAFSGLSLDAQGRVTVCLNGFGCRATFTGADQLRAVATMMTAVALQMDQTADVAAAELASIVDGSALTPRSVN